MRRLRPLLLLPLLLLSCAAADDEYRLPGIKGKDDRTLADSTVSPWRAIGRLNKEGGGHCTASIVGRRLVLTAAHCLWNGRAERWFPPQVLHFLPGWSRENYLAHARGTAIQVAPGYDPARPKVLDNMVNDWALVVLDQDVAPALGRLEVDGPDRPDLAALKKNGTRFTLAGYAQDFSEVLTVDSGCPLRGYAEGRALLMHGCDAVGGASGAPILYRDGDVFRIVAMHVGTGRAEPENLGIAVPASSFAAAVRQHGR